MKILVLNCGSSTVKYQLIDMKNENVLAKGNAERIGIKGSFVSYKTANCKEEIKAEFPTHKEAIEMILSLLTDKNKGVIKDLSEISGFGHRIVQGGPYHFDSCLVTKEVLADLRKVIDFAPLHTPAHIMGIEACQKVAKNIPNVVVFDTGFHSRMPEYAYRYAIPKEDYEKYHIRRYGAHGTSHFFVSRECAKVMGKPVKKLKLIVAHIGNGCSMTAIKDGYTVDTSMGLTPLEGLVMGTRSGDLDPAVVGFLAEKKKMTAQEVITYLNKKSGMLGLSGLSSDMRDIENNLDNPDCKLALDIMAYRMKKYIGAYTAVLNGLDAICFTAGIGENDDIIREKALENLDYLGIVLDKKKNKNFKRGQINELTGKNSKVRIFTIPTNEELVIAQDTQRIIKEINKK